MANEDACLQKGRNPTWARARGSINREGFREKWEEVLLIWGDRELRLVCLFGWFWDLGDLGSWWWMVCSWGIESARILQPFRGKEREGWREGRKGRGLDSLGMKGHLDGF